MGGMSSIDPSRLSSRDDLFKPFTDLSEEEKGREIYFVKNGFQGISEYIASLP